MKTPDQQLPGPWQYFPVQGRPAWFISSRSTPDPLQCVGYIMNEQSSARLVAAAPDLLAAARRAVSALAANGAPNCEAAKELRAAIARAEGVRR